MPSSAPEPIQCGFNLPIQKQQTSAVVHNSSISLLLPRRQRAKSPSSSHPCSVVFYVPAMMLAPSVDNKADFYAALFLCRSDKMKGLTKPSEECHRQLRPGSRAGSRKGKGVLEKRALVLRRCQGPAPLSIRTHSLTTSFLPRVPTPLQ